MSIWLFKLSSNLTSWIVFISKTSFSYLFTIDLNHVWAKFLINLAIDCAINLYPMRFFITLSIFWLLRVKQQFKHGKFDKCFNFTSFWGHFVAFLGNSFILGYFLHPYSCSMLRYTLLILFAGFKTILTRHWRLNDEVWLTTDALPAPLPVDRKEEESWT